MEEIRKQAVLRLPAFPQPERVKALLRRRPLAADALAFAVLGGGGYAALRLMGLLFRALGVD